MRLLLSHVDAVGAKVEKHRSGSETRQRTEKLNLRLLQEHQ
jgi:hypothetical protein